MPKFNFFGRKCVKNAIFIKSTQALLYILVHGWWSRSNRKISEAMTLNFSGVERRHGGPRALLHGDQHWLQSRHGTATGHNWGWVRSGDFSFCNKHQVTFEELGRAFKANSINEDVLGRRYALSYDSCLLCELRELCKLLSVALHYCSNDPEWLSWYCGVGLSEKWQSGVVVADL